MDKMEYREKLEELTDLVEQQDYEEALKIADSVDWRRVKSIRTLSMVADIYEVNKKYKRCKEILLLARSRSMIGKMVLYRLVEVSLKLGETEEAADYYLEFVDAAPNDNSRFILKYKLYKAQHAPLEDQIAILEDYREREYTERWAYELARLYAKSGRQDKCIETCDDLILWFAEGRYVRKAMELKMQYEPLSPSQQQLYTKEINREKTVTAAVKVPKKPETTAVLPVTEKPQVKHQEKGSGERHEKVQSQPHPVQQTKVQDKQREKPQKKKRPKQSTEELLQKMDSAGAAITSETSHDRARADEPERDSDYEQMPVNSPEFFGKTVDLKKQLEKSIQEVFAGLRPVREEEPNKDESTLHTGDTGVIDIQDLEPENVETEAEIAPDSSKKIFTKAEHKKKTTEETNEKQERPADDNSSSEDFDLDALLKETASDFQEELADGDIKKDGEDQKETDQKEPEQNEPDQKESDQKESGKKSDTVESDSDKDSEHPVDNTKEEKTRVISDIAEMRPEDETHEDYEENLNTIVVPEIKEPDEGNETKAYNPVRESASDATREIDPDDLGSRTRSFHTTAKEDSKSVEEVLREETPEERRMRILGGGIPEKFSEDQKRIFSYFAKIPGIDQQVLDALSGVYEHAVEKTSKHGNIAIMGGYATGKSRLSDGMILSICKDLGLSAAKYARMDSSDLNQRDPAAVVDKMSGGFFLIERAGLLYPNIIQKLNKAMEFRTDSMVVIIEDEKTSMRSLLRNNPEFAKKFEKVISIPVLTNDELVTFARTYAKESGYKMDEMGVLALYTLIGDNQTVNEPMTIGKVKDIVDKAIVKAGKGTRRFGRKMSGKRTDDHNRIILYEKDFE